ncbi:MAG: hypothetical protein MI799_14130, partial [Desulfobacterales bacterium]|nr:hypothetical protein [Desulfobacterales bacterium]
MKDKVSIINFFLATLIVICLFSSANAQVPELPNPNLPDIAMVTWHTGPIPQLGIPHYNGPIILYNPIVASQIGPLLNAFFRTHEYCHIRLNHIQ